MHHNSYLLFKKYTHPYFASSYNVLEVGPDNTPSTYADDLTACGIMPVFTYADRYESTLPNYVRFTSEYTVPLESNRFDAVLSGQVIEHVRKPWLWVKELARLLKTGGHLVIIAPVSWPYHEAPYDCWRIYPEGMKALFEDAGLQTVFATFEKMPGEGATDTIAIGRKA